MPDYSTPQGKYQQQMLQARQRGIPWEFTFDEWWSLWQESGKWEMRGKRAGQYVMARRGDIGPYSSANVYICTAEENHTEANRIRYAGHVKAPKRPTRQPRGWTYIAGRKRPYQVMYRDRYIGVFATQHEAEAAYQAALCGSEVRQDHASHFSTHI